jgi:Lon protease-like protein
MMYELPIFPLHTVLFPGMPLHLHIFEERYELMLQQVMQTNHTFGVCLIKSGSEALGPVAEPFQVGCTARILQVEPLEGGQANLTAVGDERFRIVKTGLADPYLSAFVESAPLQSHHSIDVARGARALRSRLARYLALLSELAGQQDAGQEDEPGSAGETNFNFDLTQIQFPEDSLALIYLSAALLQIPASEKQPLLEAETAAGLLQHVQRLVRRELAVLPPLLEVTPEQARAAAWVN